MIWPLAKVVSPQIIAVGDSVIIDDFVFLMGGMKTTIGSFVHIASFTSITGGGEFVMDDFAVSLVEYACILEMRTTQADR